MIEARNIKKSFGSLLVLKGIDLDVFDNEVIAIVGPSGSGKTTLLQILGTLDRADSGSIIIDNQNIDDMNNDERANFRNKNLGFIFQFHQLLPEFTAIENIMIPALIAGTKFSKAKQEAHQILQFLGLDKREHHKPNALSGGEKQRVAAARALINKPKFILADEPSGSLDTKNKEELHNLFFKLRDEFGHSFVIVTHDEYLAKDCDRTIHLIDGIIAPPK